MTQKYVYAVPSGRTVKGVGVGRLVTGIVGSNPARGMDVSLLCLYVVLSCVGRGLCDWVPRPEESYRASNTIMQKACSKRSLGMSQVPVVHESCCKVILGLMRRVQACGIPWD
jgi:hypothetical protein